MFCEGRNTEPAYFRSLQRTVANALIDLVIVPAAGVPYTLAERAVARAREIGIAGRSRRNRDSYEEKDEVWAVFDRDQHPRYDEAVALCERNQIGAARSNPCFEVWLILHESDFDRPDDRHAVQAHLCRLRPEYDATGSKLPNCADLIARIEEAERRAEAQLGRRTEEGAAFGRPSTTVFRLTRAIREAAAAARTT
ncbi:MAG TPA: RloB family protein [Acetobacteraceae bacterium]|nr:RloB family protein [Acetobacteraceae bacterium]